jgi:hypothetical protein
VIDLRSLCAMQHRISITKVETCVIDLRSLCAMQHKISTTKVETWTKLEVQTGEVQVR